MWLSIYLGTYTVHVQHIKVENVDEFQFMKIHYMFYIFKNNLNKIYKYKFYDSRYIDT